MTTKVRIAWPLFVCIKENLGTTVYRFLKVHLATQVLYDHFVSPSNFYVHLNKYAHKTQLQSLQMHQVF